MAIITRAEVKQILRLKNNSQSQNVTFSSVEYKKLNRKSNVVITRVGKDTKISTGASTQYTTNDYYTTEQYDGYTYIRRIDTGSLTDTQSIIVKYTYNDYDADIDWLIPVVQNDVLNYLNNAFPDRNTQYGSGDIEISTSGTLTDSNSKFLEEGFVSGMDIYISNTERNRGVYNAKTVAAGTITLSTKDSVVNEESTAEYGGNTIYITRVNWPNNLKIAVAQIIWENMDRVKTNNLKSKSLGPSAVTYQDLQSGGYSQRIYGILNKHRKLNTR